MTDDDLKAYRLRIISEAAENVRRERELERELSEEFNLEDVDCE